MRWACPKDQDVKVVTKFLLLPLKIGNETRWLETATIKYWYYYNLGEWLPERFINKKVNKDEQNS